MYSLSGGMSTKSSRFCKKSPPDKPRQSRPRLCRLKGNEVPKSAIRQPLESAHTRPTPGEQKLAAQGARAAAASPLATVKLTVITVGPVLVAVSLVMVVVVLIGSTVGDTVAVASPYSARRRRRRALHRQRWSRWSLPTGSWCCSGA